MISSVALLGLDGRDSAQYLCVVHLGSTGQLLVVAVLARHVENPLNSTSLQSDLLWPRHVEKQLPPQDDDFCKLAPLLPVPVAVQ